MSDGQIVYAVSKRTKERFGSPVNLHGFRHAAATFLALEDPHNAAAARDLLGHKSMNTTNEHYIVCAQSRLAGRYLASLHGVTDI